eukprot:COSAG01_NODE_10502_length_2150_cov_27.471477_1_plen_275_part_00
MDENNFVQDARQRMCIFTQHMVTADFYSKMQVKTRDDDRYSLATPASFIKAMDVLFKTHALGQYHRTKASQPFKTTCVNQDLDGIPIIQHGRRILQRAYDHHTSEQEFYRQVPQAKVLKHFIDHVVMPYQTALKNVPTVTGGTGLDLKKHLRDCMLTAIGGSPEAAKKLVRHLTADDQFLVIPPSAARQTNLRVCAALACKNFTPIDFNLEWFMKTTEDWIEEHLAEWRQEKWHFENGKPKPKSKKPQKTPTNSNCSRILAVLRSVVAARRRRL